MRPKPLAFDAQKGTLLLPIGREAVRKQLEALRPEADLRGMQEKREFHITVLGFAAGRFLSEQLATLPQEARRTALLAIEQLAQSIDWEFTLTGAKAYAIRKAYGRGDRSETRRSIILMVDMAGIQEFYRRLNTAIPQPITAPPPHVTLFTVSSDPLKGGPGIGVDSMDDFKDLHPEELHTHEAFMR